MEDNLPSAMRFYQVLRDNLGSLRKIYLRGNRIVRRGDFAQHPETVLLLHGFFQTRNVWEVMEDRLRYDGFGVFSFDLGGLFWKFNDRSISFLAEKVSEKIERVCERYDLDRFHVVAHSQGGLIARQYIQYHGGDRRAKSLITLGTPHHGTSLTLLGLWVAAGGLISRNPLQMLPGSPLLRRLRNDTFPPSIPFVSIYSKSDLVCPMPCAVLRPKPGETSLKNHPVLGVGHTALTYDPGVYHLVRKELEDAAALWKERAGTVDPPEEEYVLA
jgi:triacylglycerol lipase